MNVIYSPGLPRGFSFDPGDPRADLYLGPGGLLHGEDAAAAVGAGAARWLCDAPIAYSMVTAYFWRRDRLEIVTTSLSAVTAWAEGEDRAVADRVNACLDALSSARKRFAGMTMDRPCIFGIVNVTPDSF